MPKKTPEPMDIVIDGESGEIDLGSLPNLVKRAIEFLDKYPDGKVMPSRTFTSRLKISLPGFRTHSAHPALADYRQNIQTSRTFYWGNKRSIAALRARLNT